MWVTCAGFDRTNNLDFDEHGNSPIDFTNALGDVHSKADIRICDVGSNLSFQNGMDCVIWDETSSVGIPAHNLLRKAVLLTDTVNWIVTNTNGATVNTGGISSFTVTYSNNSVAPLVGGLREYCASGYIFPGQSYMASAYVSGSGINNVQYFFQIAWLDANYNVVSSSSASGAIPGSRTRISVSAVAPANIQNAYVLFATQATNATNAGTVTIDTLQFEPMYFASQGVSYPTPDCNYNQTNCSLMPDSTVSRYCRLFSGYIDDIHVAYNGPNRIWTLSCAAASALLENDALINYSVVNLFDEQVISSIINAFYPLSIYTGSGSNYNTTSINIVPINKFAPQPLTQGFLVGTITWSDASMRDVLNAMADASGYVFWLDPHYTLYYQPAYYNVASFQVVAAASADGITNIAPQDYSIEYDATQRKRSVKVIGEPANAPAITQGFTGTGAQTKFYLSQIPQTVTSVVKAGVTQVAGIAGVNSFGQNLGGGAITVLISQAGDSNSSTPTPYMLFQVAPANGAAITITYTYNAPVVVQVLDQSQVNNVVAPPYAVPNFWARVHDTSIADTATAIDRGLAELTKRSQPITKITFKTFQFVTPGTSIYFTSTLDNINNQSFVVRQVTGRLLGPGIHQYEIEMSDHPLPDSATTMLRHVHKAHQRSTATASVTTPQETDIVFSEFAAYNESITYTSINTFYGSSVADGTVTTACDMAKDTTGGTETTKVTTAPASGGGGQYMEMLSQGGSGTIYASLPAPTGHGWVYTGIAGHTIPAGNWAAVINIADPSNGSAVPFGGLVIRFWKLHTSGLVYTSIGLISLSQPIIAPTKTQIYFPITSMPSMSFASGDDLYVDLFINPGGGWNSDAMTLYVSNSSSSGVANDMQVMVPAYP